MTEQAILGPLTNILEHMPLWNRRGTPREEHFLNYQAAVAAKELAPSPEERQLWETLEATLQSFALGQNDEARFVFRNGAQNVLFGEIVRGRYQSPILVGHVTQGTYPYAVALRYKDESIRRLSERLPEFYKDLLPPEMRSLRIEMGNRRSASGLRSYRKRILPGAP